VARAFQRGIQAAAELHCAGRIYCVSDNDVRWIEIRGRFVGTRRRGRLTINRRYAVRTAERWRKIPSGRNERFRSKDKLLGTNRRLAAPARGARGPAQGLDVQTEARDRLVAAAATSLSAN
jgi:hypothetical protein